MNEYATTLVRPLAAATRRRRRLYARARGTVLVGALALLAAALFVLTLVVGSSHVPPIDVIASLLGVSENQGIDFIVRDLRLPVAAAALFVGVALGVSGTLFQRVLDNPLATPEIVGISAGASLAAVSGIVLFSWSGYGISAAALLGAVGGAALIYALAWRGGVSGYRLILIGIGISELTLSLIYYMVARADIHEAREAMHWLIGSIGLTGTPELRAMMIATVVLIPIAIVLNRALCSLELGDDTARALGTRVEAARLGLIAIAVVLVGFATAIAGPLAFVALVAGPIAQRLLGSTRGSIVAAGLTGASIVLLADLVAQHALPVVLPTGVVTAAVGAPYLLLLLVSLNREGRGG